MIDTDNVELGECTDKLLEAANGYYPHVIIGAALNVVVTMIATEQTLREPTIRFLNQMTKFLKDVDFSDGESDDVVNIH